MANYTHHSKYFYGNKISDYGLQHNRIDYRTLAKAFDAVLNNTIYGVGWELDEWETINGSDIYYYNDDCDTITDSEYWELDEADRDAWHEEYYEVYQYYIITSNGADILQELTNEIVYYNEKLDIYLWGVTHWGTSWDYVLTDIVIELDGGN